MVLQEGAKFFFLNLATPLVFFFAFRYLGPKWAIAFAVAVTLVQVAAHVIHRLRFSPFFILSSGFTIVFGSVDLLVAEPRYYRLAPFAENFLLGILFFITLFTERPIISWFAQALPRVIKPDLSELHPNYLRRVTQVWTAYFFVKAFFFLWLAFQVDLAELIVLRSIVGGGSLIVLFFGEILYRRRLKRRAFRSR